MAVEPALQPRSPFLRGLIALQAASWFVGNRAFEPTLADQRVEIILAKSLTVLDADEVLDFTGFAGMFAEPENLRRDLAGDLAGLKAFSFFGVFDGLGMSFG